MNETKQEQPEKMLTLVALVRMPERVARGLRAGDASLAWWCGEAVGCSWEGEWDSDPDAVKWQKEIAERWGCGPEDRETMRGHDAGFVEAGSEAEKAICRLLTMRADADEEGEVTEKVRAWEGFISDGHDNDTGGDGQEMFFLPPEGSKETMFPVRLTIEAKVHPLHLFRRRGRWCLGFDLVTAKNTDSVFAVECGEGAPLSLEEAAQLFFVGGQVTEKVPPAGEAATA